MSAQPAMLGQDDKTFAAQLEQQAALVAEITQLFVASSLDIEDTLHNSLTRFMDYLDAEACSIFLFDEDSGDLVCRKCAGPVDVTGLRLDPTLGIVGEAVQTNSCQLVRNAQDNPKFADTIDQGTGFTTRSILCAPLSVHGKCFGALELLNKRGGDGLFDNQDRYLLTAMASAAALAIHQARTAARLVQQERVQKELELAREIQEELLPTPRDDAFPIIGLNIPAREVSGDFYDFFELPDGSIYFNLGDVSGKGMNAAMLMAKTTSLLRCLAKHTDDPSALLAQVNDEIVDSATHGMFVTLVSGFLDPRRKRVRFANAGHQPPMLMVDDGSFIEYPAEAPPIGIATRQQFPLTEITLEEGALYLFTDGLTEQIDSGGNAVGTTGIRDIFLKHRAEAGRRRLLNIIDSVMGAGKEQRDDMTVMIVECR